MEPIKKSNKKGWETFDNEGQPPVATQNRVFFFVGAFPKWDFDLNIYMYR